MRRWITATGAAGLLGAAGIAGAALGAVPDDSKACRVVSSDSAVQDRTITYPNGTRAKSYRTVYAETRKCGDSYSTEISFSAWSAGSPTGPTN